MQWLLIGAGVLAALIALALAARSAWRRSIRAEVKDFLANEFPDVRVTAETSASMQLEGRDFDGAQVNLANLFAALASEPGDDSEERRRGIYQQFFDGALGQIAGLTAPLELDRVRERLLPMLVAQDFVATLSEHGAVPHRLIAETELSVVYVMDHESAVSYLTEQQREELAISETELYGIALDNLRERMTAEPVRSAVDGPNLVAVKTGDAYDATRLLLVQEHLNDGEEVAACVPDRDTLVLAPVPEDADWSGLEKLARSPASDRIVLDRPLRVRRHSIETV